MALCTLGRVSLSVASHTFLSLLTSASAFAVVGYVPDYRYGGIDWESVSSLATHLIFFSVGANPDGSLSDLERLPSPRQLEKARAARERHGTKLLACVGGAGRSTGLQQVVMGGKAARRNFVQSALRLVEQKGFDGLDIDYEGHISAADTAGWRGFANILKDLSHAFTSNGRSLTLTIAYHPIAQEQVLKTLTTSAGKSIVDFVDLFHAMAYDSASQGGGVAKHSTRKLAAEVVESWSRHMPAGSLHKLTLGIPCYGRMTSNPGQAKTYRELAEASPDLSDSSDEAEGYFFNNVITVKQKVRFAKRKGLAGVMMWEIGQDMPPTSPRSLLRAMHDEAVAASRTAGGEPSAEL